MTGSLSTVARLFPTAGYMALIYYVSSIPAWRLPVPPGSYDRLLHLGEFFVLGLLLMYSTGAFTSVFRLGHYLMAGTVGVLYAVSDEWHQSFVPGRDSSVADLVFNGIGIMLALGIVYARKSPTR